MNLKKKCAKHFLHVYKIKRNWIVFPVVSELSFMQTRAVCNHNRLNEPALQRLCGEGSVSREDGSVLAVELMKAALLKLCKTDLCVHVWAAIFILLWERGARAECHQRTLLLPQLLINRLHSDAFQGAKLITQSLFFISQWPQISVLQHRQPTKKILLQDKLLVVHCKKLVLV